MSQPRAVFDGVESPQNSLLTVTSTRVEGVKKIRYDPETMRGRERERQSLVEYVQEFVSEEASRLTTLRVKMTRSLSKDILIHCVSRDDAKCSGDFTDVSGRPILQCIDRGFIERFCHRFDRH